MRALPLLVVALLVHAGCSAGRPARTRAAAMPAAGPSTVPGPAPSASALFVPPLKPAASAAPSAPAKALDQATLASALVRAGAERVLAAPDSSPTVPWTLAVAGPTPLEALPSWRAVEKHFYPHAPKPSATDAAARALVCEPDPKRAGACDPGAALVWTDARLAWSAQLLVAKPGGGFALVADLLTDIARFDWCPASPEPELVVARRGALVHVHAGYRSLSDNRQTCNDEDVIEDVVIDPAHDQLLVRVQQWSPKDVVAVALLDEHTLRLRGASHDETVKLP